MIQTEARTTTLLGLLIVLVIVAGVLPALSNIAKQKRGVSIESFSESAAAGGGMSTCEFRPEYGCYKEASCEPQANGECGWTQSNELRQCLQNPPELE